MSFVARAEKLSDKAAVGKAEAFNKFSTFEGTRDILFVADVMAPRGGLVSDQNVSEVVIRG